MWSYIVTTESSRKSGPVAGTCSIHEFCCEQSLHGWTPGFCSHRWAQYEFLPLVVKWYGEYTWSIVVMTHLPHCDRNEWYIYIYILIHDTCICRIRSNHQHETCSWTVQVAMQAEFRQLDNKVSCLMSRCNGWMNGFGGSTSVKNQLRSLHYQRCLVLLKPNIFFKNACSLALVTWFTFLHGTSLFGPLVLSTSGDICCHMLSNRKQGSFLKFWSFWGACCCPFKAG